MRCSGLAWLGGLCGLTASMAGCGAFIPSAPDAAMPVDASADVPPLPDVPSGLACESDEDCAPYAGCCFDLVCDAGQCAPRLIADCCSAPGPCATTGAFQAGTCETSCAAGGCRAQLVLPASGCDGPTWRASFDAASLTSWSFEDTAADPVTWHVSTRRTFDGAPTLRAGNTLCANYHAGPPTSPADPCAPDPGPDGPIHLVARTGPLRLPANAPSVLLVWLWIDVGAASATAIDGLDIDVIATSGIGVPGWSSRTHAIPSREWTPVAIDVSALAGQEVSIAWTFDAPDGSPHAHEGGYVGAARLWTPCASERACPTAGACAAGTLVPIEPLADALCVTAWPEPGTRCEACSTATSCTVGACERASCEDGACRLATEPEDVCCDPAPTWPGGDGSFEAAGSAVDGWVYEGAGWAASALRAHAGIGSLHFGASDGTALAPAGEAADGTAWTPPLAIPALAPRWVFWLWLSTEWDLAQGAESLDNPANLDRLEARVRVETVPGPTVLEATVWSSDEIGGTTAGRWVAVVVGLDAWAGQTVRLGWRFATGDAENNAFEGAFIDDATVFRACPGCDRGRVDAPGCRAP